MDGWIEGTFCSSCAGSGSHIVPGEAGCHLWFKGPSLSTDGNRTWPLWRPLHSFLKEHQIKHAWDGDRGGPATFLPSLSLPLHSVFTLLSQKKKKKKKHLEEDCVSLVLGELKVEATALQKQELSWCFAYIIALKQISVRNTTTYKRRASCRSNYGGLAWRLIGGAMCLFQNLYLFKEGFRRVQTFLSSTALSRTP